MTDLRFGLRVSAAIFIMIAVVHVIRVAGHLSVHIGNQPIPMWASVVATVIFGFLGIWLWRLPNRSGAA